MRTIVLSGAGLSAPSGIPTFRGAGGVYNNLSAESLLSARSYKTQPAKVEAFIDQLRTAARAAEPNAAHQGLAAYQRAHPDTALFTQNVDDLLERAGAPNVIHLHGTLGRFRCLGHAHLVAAGDSHWNSNRRCEQCNSRLRSDIVLFQEPAPEYARLRSTLRQARRADVLLVIGTQGNVLPIADIAFRFPGRKILNNLHPSDSIPEALFDQTFMEDTTTAWPGIAALLHRWRAETP